MSNRSLEDEVIQLRQDNRRMVEFLSAQLADVCKNRNVNDIEHKVLDLLKAGADPNLPTGKPAPLFSAMKNVQLYGLFEKLLKFGANPNTIDATSGSTAMHEALKKADSFYIKLLLAHDANPGLPTPCGTALEFAEQNSNVDPHVLDMMRAAAARQYAVEVLDEIGSIPKVRVRP